MSKITEIRPSKCEESCEKEPSSVKMGKKPMLQSDGGGGYSLYDAIVIERVDNGHIVRYIKSTDNPEIQHEEVLVYVDRDALMRDIASRL